MNNGWKGFSVQLIKAINYYTYYYHKTKRGVRREKERLTNFWFWKGHQLLPCHICRASWLTSYLAGSPSFWLFASINYPFNQSYFRHKVSSMGAADMSPCAVTRWPWKRAAGCGKQGVWGHARHPVGAPSTPAVAESQRQENHALLQKELLEPEGHLVLFPFESWLKSWCSSQPTRILGSPVKPFSELGPCPSVSLFHTNMSSC